MQGARQIQVGPFASHENKEANPKSGGKPAFLTLRLWELLSFLLGCEPAFLTLRLWELRVLAKLKASPSGRIQIRVTVVNKSSCPSFVRLEDDFRRMQCRQPLKH